MNKYGKITLPGVLERSVNKFGKRIAFSFIKETPITFKEVGKKVNALVAFLEETGIKSGDKVGILSVNMPNWGISYFAIASMGAVVVPMLPDFSNDEVSNVIDHSEMKAILVSKSLKRKISDKHISQLGCLINIEDFSSNSDNCCSEFNIDATPKLQYTVNESDMASIIYTSGTTGKSKGVMLSHKNVISNANASREIPPIVAGDRYLSILPLSHTYENTLGLILPIMCGAAVYYLRKPPTPSVLIPAMKLVRPTVFLSVPLIIEKIYKSKVLPTFNKTLTTRLLYRVPFLRKKFNMLAGKKLFRTFGGEIKFFGIGGAKLNREVERFLIEAKFPYSIGYGLTETAPLIAGMAVGVRKLQSTGQIVKGVEVKINNPQKYSGEGEIWVKGPNVMMGYYKEPKLTSEVITKDGWFKTGDLGLLDDNNDLFIRGRSKNVIIGSSGENIFPEDIESIINNFKHVAESVVIQQKGKLVALVHFNREEIEQQYTNLREEVSLFVDNKCDELKNELQVYVNAKVSKFSRIHAVIPVAEEFQKTATKKIKRFVYAKA